jgi:hypothetical protein
MRVVYAGRKTYTGRMRSASCCTVAALCCCTKHWIYREGPRHLTPRCKTLGQFQKLTAAEYGRCQAVQLLLLLPRI